MIEIGIVEKINSVGIVKEYQDPLSRKVKPKVKRPKVSEHLSQTEKELYHESDTIIKKRIRIEDDKIIQKKMLVYNFLKTFKRLTRKFFPKTLFRSIKN